MMTIVLLLNMIITTLESICFISYFLKCHSKKYSYIKLLLILVLSIVNGVLPSYILPSYAMISSLIGLFLIFYIFFSKQLIDFILSIGVVYIIILLSNSLGDLIIVRFIKLSSFINTNKIITTMLPLSIIEFITLNLFLYKIKYFVILHNRIIQSKKTFFIITIIFQFILVFIIGVLFDKNTNVYMRVGLVAGYFILFILSFVSFIKDYFSVYEKVSLLEESQQITQQFQEIQTKYATQFSKLLGMTQLKQFNKMEYELKSFIQENSNNSIKITNNLHLILVSSLQKFYDDKVEVIIDNQINLKDLKIELFNLLNVLTNISEYISLILNNQSNFNTDKNKYKIIFKIRDYYDEFEFLYKIYYNDEKIKSFNNMNEFIKLKEIITGNQGRIKISCNSAIKLYLPKK